MDGEKKFSWTVHVSSGGNLDASLVGKNLIKDRNAQIHATAFALAEGVRFMRQQGYISRLLLSEDKEVSRWRGLLESGTVRYLADEHGRLRVHLWVPGYLGSDQEVGEYVRKVNKALKDIHDAGGGIMRHIDCPSCGSHTVDYSVNEYQDTNALCRAAGCDFRMSVTTRAQI